MKQLYILVFLLISFYSYSQSNSSSYSMSSNKIDDLTITVKYEKIKVNGRSLWGTQIPYNVVWKPGITSPPILSLDNSAVINQKQIPAGRYSLFTVPNTRYWTIMVTKESEIFSEEDVIVSFQVPVKSIPGKVEQMQFSINDFGNVTFAWDKILWSFDIDSM
ncbi:DUF2911 domain-containing protein [Marinigracilibium pacificum]|uniref:DUF2911 domain-containing protein n=1 Tax=Marinigracilibium pacificum TaxID=2729599 RepID=A0A848J5N6_9BACT|nr:DUF2911 domain-containing protein [Marinigracilibium pacificum]NMM50558.1 DUF2911 domain-containing protein [Marinigracilibium pacificum]